MIHSVGTDHELQHTGKPSQAPVETANKARDDLKAHLRQLAEEIRPTVIAEEFSPDVLNILNAASNVKAVADQLCIEHRFCDPSIAERARVGLPLHGTEDCDPGERRRFDAIREAYRLEALTDVLDRTVLFVCGADHVSSFSRLRHERGIAARVLRGVFRE